MAETSVNSFTCPTRPLAYPRKVWTYPLVTRNAALPIITQAVYCNRSDGMVQRDQP